MGRTGAASTAFRAGGAAGEPHGVCTSFRRRPCSSIPCLCSPAPLPSVIIPPWPGSSDPGAASCCTSAMSPRAREAAVKHTKCIRGKIVIQAFRQRFRCSARSRHSHSLNSVRLLSSLRHACMAFSHARFVRDSSHGEGGSRARNSARRPVSSVSKYARKELVSSMSFQAWYSLDR